MNVRLRRHIEAFAEAKQVEAVAPLVSPLWKNHRSLKYGFASSWSERHAAYAAGLGTFGLCDGLITARGKAHRAGSVIVNSPIEPSERPYDDPHAYCLFHSDGSCGKCMKRCPIGAITEDGHNKELCNLYLDVTREYVTRHFGFEGYGCGLCQTSTPCEFRIPKSIRRKLAAGSG
ncbi:MAG: hypothetical protein ACE5EF_06020 [Dehalococcoidia bacterium]